MMKLTDGPLAKLDTAGQQFFAHRQDHRTDRAST